MSTSAWFAAGSLAVAFVALGLGVFNTLARVRADGRAHFTAMWGRSDSRMTFTNVGPGYAYAVTATATCGDEAVDEPTVLGPISAMAPGQSLSLEVLTRFGQKEPHRLDVQWKDNRRGEQSSDVPLGHPPRPTPRPPTSGLEDALRKLARQEASDECDGREEMESMRRRAGRRRP